MISVGNLNFRTSSQTLKEAFAAVGEVEKAVISRDQKTGRPMGHGIVRFATPELAQKAVVEMNNKDIEGRNITVKVDEMC